METLIVQKMDSTHSLPFNYISINPLPFVGVLKYGFNNKNNVALGANIKINLPKKNIFYAQYYYDGKQNGVTQMAYQVGLKSYWLKNIGIGSEYNLANPYTYMHTNAFQAATHYNQPLANPNGANFTEWINWIRLQFNRWYCFGKFHIIHQQLIDNNPIMTINDAPVGSTSEINKHIIDLRIGHILNPKNNLCIEAGVMQWQTSLNNLQKSSTYYYFGVKSYIQNKYFDF